MGVQHTFGGVSRVVFPIAAGVMMDRFGMGIPFLVSGLLVVLTLPLASAMESYAPAKSSCFERSSEDFIGGYHRGVRGRTAFRVHDSGEDRRDESLGARQTAFTASYSVQWVERAGPPPLTAHRSPFTAMTDAKHCLQSDTVRSGRRVGRFACDGGADLARLGG